MINQQGALFLQPNSNKLGIENYYFELETEMVERAGIPDVGAGL